MYLLQFIAFLKLKTITIQFQPILDIIHDSNFDAKLMSSQIFSIWKCYDIASNLIRSRCSSNDYTMETYDFFVVYIST